MLFKIYLEIHKEVYVYYCHLLHKIMQDVLLHNVQVLVGLFVKKSEMPSNVS